VPWLANVKPSGKYLMEDFYYAGGLPALLGKLAKVRGALYLDRMTVSGGSFGVTCWPRESVTWCGSRTPG
jgi:dihydroxy-acid dehydratase